MVYICIMHFGMLYLGTKPSPLPHTSVIMTLLCLSANKDTQNGVILLSIIKIDGPTYQIQPQAEPNPGLSTVGKALTTRQLIVHRGLAVTAAVAVLIGGVAIRLVTL